MNPKSHITGGNLDVHSVMHDFERALINSCERWFACYYHLGCFFHWKQAIRKKMVEMKFDFEIISEIWPMMDFLTVVPKADIRNGIEYIRDRVLKEKRYKKQVRIDSEKFLDEYFIPFWMQRKLVEMYNYNDDEDWKREM